MHGKVYAAKAHAFMEGLRQGAFFFFFSDSTHPVGRKG